MGLRKKKALALVREIRGIPLPPDTWKYIPIKYRKHVTPAQMWEVKYRAHVKYDSKRPGHDADIEVEVTAVAVSKKQAIWNIQAAIYGEVSSETNPSMGRMAAGMIEDGRFKKGNIKTEGKYDEKQIWAIKETTDVKKYEFTHPRADEEERKTEYEYTHPEGYWVK